MRRIFTSQRLENVEAVAQLMETAGIEVRIEHPRSFRSAIRGNFSYLDKDRRNRPPAAVWVVRADDQPRARGLLREAGLLQDTTRDPAPVPGASPDGETAAKKRIARLRYGLLALVLVIVVVNFIRRPADAPAPAGNPAVAPAASPALALLDAAAPTERAYVIATPPQLAVMLARRVLATQPARILCLAIDGSDPAQDALDTLAADGIAVQPDSTCQHADALHVNVHDYTTEGSGTGDVSLALHASGQERRSDTVRVRRTGTAWAVLDAPH